MKKSSKAALMSALILPGAGHIYVRAFARGIALIVIAGASLYYLIAKTTENALQIVAQIQSGDVPLELNAITKLTEETATGANSQFLEYATVIIIACWIIGIIDAYRLGRQQDAAPPH